MSSFLNSSPTNSKFNNYLSVCDLTNKYNLKNTNESPKLFKIILEFSSLDILSACENVNRKEFDSELQLKSFFLLYILECQRPFVNLNKINITKDSGMNYSVKVILSSKEELNSFLTTMFIENWDLLFSEDFSLIKGFRAKYNKYLQQNRKFVINTQIPGNTFFEIETFLNKNTFNLSLKNLSLRASFVFENKISYAKKLDLNLVKNTPLFWVTATK
jgi:hypothetical protein